MQIIPVTYPMGQGEPANIIISGNSDVDVLRHQEVDGGLLNYFEYVVFLGFSRFRVPYLPTLPSFSLPPPSFGSRSPQSCLSSC